MSEEKVKFDKRHAHRSWQKRYPDKEERIKVLQRELKDCRLKPEKYPNTTQHIEDMLLDLGVEA